MLRVHALVESFGDGILDEVGRDHHAAGPVGGSDPIALFDPRSRAAANVTTDRIVAERSS
jgi:hypothetical protein